VFRQATAKPRENGIILFTQRTARRALKYGQNAIRLKLYYPPTAGITVTSRSLRRIASSGRSRVLAECHFYGFLPYDKASETSGCKFLIAAVAEGGHGPPPKALPNFVDAKAGARLRGLVG
jgi:hypothetical protein